MSSAMSSRIKPAIACLSLGVVALDQWTKWLIEHTVETFETIEVIPDFFNIIHVTNTGIAFGLFPSHGSVLGTAMLAALGIVALGIVTFYFWKAPPSQGLLLAALSLVMGGAIGNLIDRVFLGQVTDFFDFFIGTRHWPTFNVADSAISVGIVLLALETLLPATARGAQTGVAHDQGLAEDSG